MATKRAKIIDPKELSGILAYLDAYSPCPESDRLKVLLSFRAGLRVGEIAKLTIDAVTTATGKIANHISIFSHVTKGGRERQVPMHPDVAEAVRQFRKVYPDADRFAIGPTGRLQSVSTLTWWFWQLYKKLGLEGCSSHSGRRTFITQLARRIPSSGGSLRDVQLIVGHSRLDTTQAYIEPSRRAAAMIALLGDKSFDRQDTDDFGSRKLKAQMLASLSSAERRKATCARKRPPSPSDHGRSAGQ